MCLRIRKVWWLALLLVFLLAVLFVALRDLRRLFHAYHFVSIGKYAEARTENERLARSWLALLPSVRHATRYGIAMSLHMEGKHEQALATLGRIDRRKVDRNLSYAIASLEASTLVLSEGDLSRAKDLLESLDEAQRQPEDLLFLAHTDVARAEELLARAIRPRAGATYEAIFHTTRGLLFVKLGRADEAMKDFERAAAIPLSNWYTDRARSLLPKGSGEGDPRSSLAPQTIEE